MQEEIDRLQDAIKALIKRKSCRRWYVQIEETLTVSEVSNILATKDVSSCKEGEKPARRVRAEGRCSCYSEIRHNSYTYKVETEELEDSNASK
jgi:hypothetical protein